MNALAVASLHDPAVFFDGVCTFCNGTVRFLIARDPKARLRFATLQSEVAKELLANQPVDPQALDAIVLLENGRCYEESTAALRIARYLRAPWPLLGLFVVVPRPIRDAIYRWVARNRYRWSGKEEHCRVPSPEERGRFLDGAELAE